MMLDENEVGGLISVGGFLAPQSAARLRLGREYLVQSDAPALHSMREVIDPGGKNSADARERRLALDVGASTAAPATAGYHLTGLAPM